MEDHMNRMAVSKHGSTKAAAYEATGGKLNTMQILHAAISQALDRADIICGEQNGKCIEGCPFGNTEKCSMMQGLEIYKDAIAGGEQHG
jgi:hypothetical protein